MVNRRRVNRRAAVFHIKSDPSSRRASAQARNKKSRRNDAGVYKNRKKDKAFPCKIVKCNQTDDEKEDFVWTQGFCIKEDEGFDSPTSEKL